MHICIRREDLPQKIQLLFTHIPVNMTTQQDIFSIIAEDRRAPDEVLSQLVSEKYNVTVDHEELAKQKKLFNIRFDRGKKRRLSLTDVVSGGDSLCKVFQPKSADWMYAEGAREEPPSAPTAVEPVLVEPAPVHPRKLFQICKDPQKQRKVQHIYDAI